MMQENERGQVIVRWKGTDSGRTTYWVEESRLGLLRVGSTEAKRAVAIGVAVFAYQDLP